MKKYKKSLILGLIVGVILGIVAIVLENSFNVKIKEFLAYYWKFALVILFLIFLFNFIYTYIYSRKIRGLVKLFNEGNYNEFIKENQALLKRVKGNHLKTVLKLNLSAGYIEAENYEAGRQILEDIEEDNINGKGLKLVYWINSCVLAFKVADYPSLKKLYLSKKDFFKNYKNDKNYKENLEQLEIFYEIAEENYDQALDLISAARSIWTDSKSLKDLDVLEGLVKERMSV